MSVFFILMPVSFLVAVGFLIAFVWAVKNGQYDDRHTPAMRILLEDRANHLDLPEKLEQENLGESL